MSNLDDLIAAITQLKETVEISNKQVNGRLSTIETRITELSGGLAVVLNRSEENKKASEEHKKKLDSWPNTVLNLTGD